MPIINTSHSARLRTIIPNISYRRAINMHVADMMSKTGVYNLLSKEDLHELIFRWTVFNSQKMNEDFFINDLVSIINTKENKLELTSDILTNYLGSYLPFKRLNVTREDWEKQQKYVLKVLAEKRAYNIIETAQIIATCIVNQISDEEEIAMQTLAKSRINDLISTSVNLSRFQNLLDKIEASELNTALKIMFPNTSINIQLGLELIQWYWLYINGMVLEEVDNPKNIVIDGLFDFDPKVIKKIEPDYTTDYIIEKYNLKKTAILLNSY